MPTYAVATIPPSSTFGVRALDPAATSTPPAPTTGQLWPRAG